MKNAFKTKSTLPLSEAEQALAGWGIEYKKKPDGTLYVPGDLDISNRGLSVLPDLSGVLVGGGFSCFGNKLTSLKGCPKSVTVFLYCHFNELTSLEGAPPAVGVIYCKHNKLVSLEHAPRHFDRLVCDFGDFSEWPSVPQVLRTAPVKHPRGFNL